MMPEERATARIRVLPPPATAEEQLDRWRAGSLALFGAMIGVVPPGTRAMKILLFLMDGGDFACPECQPTESVPCREHFNPVFAGI